LVFVLLIIYAAPFSEDEFIAQVDTNTFGTVRTIKGALPHFRSLAESGGATIVNIGSLVTYGHFPACSAYGASKAAVEGLSETLALEVGPAKIRVVLIDLGIFRTRFLHAAVKPKSGLDEAYVGGSVDNTVSFLDGIAGKQPGDPALAAKRIVEIVDGTGLAKDLATQGYGKLLRVPLGSDAYDAIKGREATLAETRALETLARSTDFAN
jgi:NAD(P)-dependent dehydrogenase (short-subunit alcohol dehydrogenase family)